MGKEIAVKTRVDVSGISKKYVTMVSLNDNMHLKTLHPSLTIRRENKG